MSIEELLLPRYKVTADYPDSEFQVGEILLQCKDGIRLVSLTRNMYIDWFKIDKYPHLFKKLEWWEGWTPEEMPEYVKVIREDCAKDTGLYCKVYKWHTYDDKFPLVEGQLGAELEGYKPPYILNSRFNFEGQIYGRLNATHLLPATAEEYEAFKSKTTTNE